MTVSAVGRKAQPVRRPLAMAERTRIPVDGNGLARCLKGELVYEPDISGLDFPFPRRLAAQGTALAGGRAAAGGEPGLRRPAWPPGASPEAFSSADCEFLRQLSEHVALAAHQAQLYTRAAAGLRRSAPDAAGGACSRSGCARSGRWPAASPTTSTTPSRPSRSTPSPAGERAEPQRARARVSGDDRSAPSRTSRTTVARMREFYRQREPQLTLAPVDLNHWCSRSCDLTRARWSDMPQQRGIVIATAHRAGAGPAPRSLASRAKSARRSPISSSTPWTPCRRAAR